MNFVQRSFENYRIRSKQKITAIWREGLVLGIIIGAMATILIGWVIN